MKRSISLGLGMMAVVLLLTAAPDAALAQAPEDDAAGGDVPEAVTPFIHSVQNNVNPAPFTYLTPFTELLSSTIGIMARGLDPRGTVPLAYQGRSNNAPPPGLAWEALPEVYVAPNMPPNAPATQGAGLVPFRDPAPAFSRNILIPRDFSSSPIQTEPHIAVNPNDPDHLVMGSVDYNFPNVSIYVSIDGGVTWEGPSQPPYLADDLGAGGDPVVAFDRDGNVYVIFISIGVEEFTVGQAADQATVSSIGITKSEDGGRTWSEPISATRSKIGRDLSPGERGRLEGTVSLGFLDKPWMTIGPSADDLSKDAIYITYTEFESVYPIVFPFAGNFPFFGIPVLETSIKVVSSVDGGRSWSDPQLVSPVVRRIFARGSGSEEGTSEETQELQDSTTDAEGTQRVLQGSQPQVATDGTLYVTWLDSTDDDSMEGLAENYVARSEDGGETFGKPVRTGVFNEPGFRPRNGFFRYWGSAFPQIATGPGDEVYIVYTARPPDSTVDDGDIYFTRSKDRGETWTRPRALNGDETHNLQFFPSIAASPNGDLHVMWGDFRDDRSQTRYHIYYTTSTDEGDTWGFRDEELDIDTPDTRVTDFHSNANRGFPGGVFIGDYFSIAASDEDVYLTWADTRLGEFGPINQKIGFTRRSQIQSPEVFLNPPAGPGGQPVTLQGFNFQPDINVLIRVGGVSVATERTNELGRFTSQVFIPISGEGAHAIDVFDDSGNFATSSFYMEFGFDNIQDTQEELVDKVGALESQLAGLAGLADTLTAPPPAPAPEEREEPAMEIVVPEIPAPIVEITQAPWWLLALAIAVTAAVVGGLAYLAGKRPQAPTGA